MSYIDKLKPIGSNPGTSTNKVASTATSVSTGGGYLSKLSPVSSNEVTPKSEVKGGLVGEILTGSTQRFGSSIGQALALGTKDADALRESNAGLTSKQTEVQNLIDQKKSRGEDTSRLESTLAKTKPIATQTSQEEVFPVLKKSAKQIVGEGIGTGLEALSGGVLSSGAKTVAAKGIPVLKKLNKLGKVGAAYGAIGSGSNAMQQDKSLGGIVGDTITGAAVGYGVGAGTAGAGILGSKTLNAIKNKVAPTTEVLTSKLDSNIKNIYKNTTGDVGKINESAFKAKKGLELLQKESANIKIPDINAPLGSEATKKFDISKSKPNELISAVVEMDKKISENARTAVNEATKKGKIIDIKEAQSTIMRAMDNGDIPEATGNRILKQINNTKGDPTKVHDWVQDVNKKYGKKYERGTIDDTALGNLADDIAQSFRTKLDDIVDRKGYAEAFSNNQELKRMFINIAKKANKSVNFGDIGTDAGVDAAISMLTGNPLYMARTVGTSLFKGFVSNIKNQSGLKLIKNSAEIAGKLPTIQKLPSPEVKPISKLPVKSIGGTNKIRFSNDFRSETLPTIKMGKKPLPKLKRNINPELPTIEGKTNLNVVGAGSAVGGAGILAGNLLGKTSNMSSVYNNQSSVKKESDKVIDGFDISKWATDPKHEVKVKNIYKNIPDTNDGQSLDTYIKSKFVKSPITGDMIYRTSKKYNVPVKLLVSIMQQDSGLGTTGLGSKNFNPGNVANNDSGNIQKYSSWSDGVDAVGKWLVKLNNK